MTTEADILIEVERFIGVHDMPPSTFGRKAVGDANLIDDLRSGRELRRATEAKVRDFMQVFVAETGDQVPPADSEAVR